MVQPVDPGSGLGLVLGWLARPYDVHRVVSTTLGVSPHVSRQLVGTVLATSPEAEELLAAMPGILRSLAIATSNRPQRCVGEVRGPILWSETMAARAASAGDPGIFVCASPTRAYDTEENRVLRAALHAVQVAGRAAATGSEESEPDLVGRARHNGQQASRVLDHQTLVGVAEVHPSGRELRRTRAGSRRHTYRPAVALLARAAEPLTAAHVLSGTTAHTRARLDLFATVLAGRSAQTGATPVVRCDHGALVSGPVAFSRAPGLEPAGRWDGVRVGDVLLDVPDPGTPDVEQARAALQARAGSGRCVLVTSADDLDEVLAAATP